MIANTPEPPYYAVLFTSQKNSDDSGYELMANKMVNLAQLQPGFLGMESVRGEDGFGITISYWQSLESISHWKKNMEHQEAQSLGKEKWYRHFKVRVCKVERDYEF